MAVAQWVKRWSSVHRAVQAECSSPNKDIHLFFSAVIFISVLLGLMGFSDIVILCGRTNSCCQQSLLKCFHCRYYPEVCFMKE